MRARARTHTRSNDRRSERASSRVEKRLVDISARRLSGMTARPALSPPFPLPPSPSHNHVTRLPPRSLFLRVPTIGALYDTLWTSDAQRATRSRFAVPSISRARHTFFTTSYASLYLSVAPSFSLHEAFALCLLTYICMAG